MADIVGLDGKPKTVDGNLPAVGSIVDLLGSLLERARAGELRAIGVAAVLPGSTVTTLFEAGAEVNSHELMAAVTYLQFRYASHRAGD